MKTKIVEFTNTFNWGKFLVGSFDEAEWSRTTEIEHPPGVVSGISLLWRLGWTPEHLWVLDLSTGEGALFRSGGNARADLEKHKVWVCPMFEPFLRWLYAHPEHCKDISTLPDLVTATDEATMRASAIYGYRRSGQPPEAGT